jgi:hypothetical protein
MPKQKPSRTETRHTACSIAVSSPRDRDRDAARELRAERATEQGQASARGMGMNKRKKDDTSTSSSGSPNPGPRVSRYAVCLAVGGRYMHPAKDAELSCLELFHSANLTIGPWTLLQL